MAHKGRDCLLGLWPIRRRPRPVLPLPPKRLLECRGLVAVDTSGRMSPVRLEWMNESRNMDPRWRIEREIHWHYEAMLQRRTHELPAFHGEVDDNMVRLATQNKGLVTEITQAFEENLDTRLHVHSPYETGVARRYDLKTLALMDFDRLYTLTFVAVAMAAFNSHKIMRRRIFPRRTS